MKKLIVMIAAAASMMVASCGNDPQQIAQQADDCLSAANPMECSQFRDAGGDVQQYLIGGLAGAAGGYMLAKMMMPNGGGERYYMQRDPSYRGSFRPITRYENSRRFVTSPSYRPYSVRYNRPISAMPTKRVTTTTKTVTKRGMFGGTKTTTTTTRKSSWGSSSRSSSRRSGRR